MRIAYVQKNFHANNAGIVAGLTARGHAFLPIVQVPPGTKSPQGSQSLEPAIVPYRASSQRRYADDDKLLARRGLPVIRQLSQTLRDFRPDVVIVREVRGVSLVAIQIARWLRATPVLLWDKPLTARKRPLLALLGPLLLPRRKIHMASFGEIGGTVHLGGLIGRSLLSTYPATPGPERQRTQTAAISRVRLVSIGSLDNRVKRLDWITDAIADRGLGELVDVTFIGLGSESSHFVRAVREREEALGVAPATFLFNVPHPEVMRMLPSFDILVHPALKGLADVVIAEAMASGIPPLCSERCGTHICFVDGESGRVFHSDSKTDFAAKLEELVRDDQLRRTMGVAAQQRAQQHLTPEVWVRRFESLVEHWPPEEHLGA